MAPLDLFGQRPLYVDAATGARSRSALALRPRGLDRAVAAAVLAGQLDPGRSLFLGLLPSPSRLRRGWADRSFVAGAGGAPQDDEGAGSELLAALAAAVRRLAPPGAADVSLSGGLDSALLAALLARDGRAGRAFTLSADYDATGEPERAEALGRRLGFEPLPVELREDELPDRFEDAVRAAEAPLWNGKAAAALLYFERCRAAGAEALVSGCGADDVLCGQPEALLGRHERAAHERALAEALLLPDARAALPPPERPPASLVQARERWLATALPESTLVPECRLSAAAGVEARLPYLEAGFAALALALPEGQLVRDGRGKWLLRRAAEALLPREPCWQPKQPRLAPAGGGSPRARRAWSERLEAWLAPARLAALELVDVAAARALLARHASGTLPPAGHARADAVRLRLAGLTVRRGRVDNPGGEA